MKPRILFLGLLALLLALLLPEILSAQRGNIIEPSGTSITVPSGAQICADTIFANNPGYGTLTLMDPSGVCAGAVVIPVELLTFSAVLQNSVVRLTWTTATETHNFGFEVQRSTVSGNWTSLGFVEGHGSSTDQHSYGFSDLLADILPTSTVLRYRLKQIDLDGRYEFSPEVEVQLDAPLPRFALEGYPSPCDDQLTVRMTLGDAGLESLRLYDLSGRVMLEITQGMNLRSGYHTLQVNTTEIPSGLYLLTAEGDDGRQTAKVLIRH